MSSSAACRRDQVPSARKAQPPTTGSEDAPGLRRTSSRSVAEANSRIVRSRGLVISVEPSAVFGQHDGGVADHSWAQRQAGSIRDRRSNVLCLNRLLRIILLFQVGLAGAPDLTSHHKRAENWRRRTRFGSRGGRPRPGRAVGSRRAVRRPGRRSRTAAGSAEPLSGKLRSPVSLARQMRSSHLARFRSSRSASWPFLASVAKAVKRARRRR